MRVHLVAPRDGWVLDKIASSFEFPGGTRARTPDPKADINFYINYALLKRPSGSLDVGLFTHKHPGPAAETWDTCAAMSHHCVAMCRKSADELPADKTSICLLPPFGRFLGRSLKLGFVGREYKSSPRKRFEWINTIADIPGVTCDWANGGTPDHDLPEFYRSLDYLVITAEREGGPMPLVEALAMGTPVIAPDVGFAWDYPVIRYEGLPELKRIVRNLVFPFDAWERTSERLGMLFETLLERKANA
ncbi:Glycosyl transferases group 1 [Planctomycetes bacterium Pan216]|uniref:Glycosyl transferases group 1 n=2 Tax=Kolteria novifilia TaxID=2527975 RepID=A0A518AZ32_9BACT|nr:Glycosyl transferases group 1 [Planctomycetes bacterium Pan216]